MEPPWMRPEDNLKQYFDYPENEQDAIFWVQDCAKSLGAYAGQFEDALKLFDWCRLEINRQSAMMSVKSKEIQDALANPLSGEANRYERLDKEERQLRDQISLLIRWSFIAARDGALSIFHFAKAMDGLLDLRDCPTFKTEIDHSTVRIARKLFNSRFPDFLSIRHAVAHSAELTSSAKSREANAIKKPVNAFGVKTDGTKMAMIRQNIHGRSFINTFLGRLVVYEVSAKTLESLTDVKDRIISALPKQQWPDRPPARGAE